jgi:regulatory protein
LNGQESDNPLPPIRDRAMRYLARREHTRLELARKLTRAGYQEEDIESVLKDFIRLGWLSDERFAENYVQQKQARFGNLKLASELRNRGVDESTMQQLLSSAKETELDRAREIWKKKFDAVPENAKDKARQMRFLQGRGFSIDTILHVISNSLD